MASATNVWLHDTPILTSPKVVLAKLLQADSFAMGEVDELAANDANGCLCYVAFYILFRNDTAM